MIKRIIFDVDNTLIMWKDKYRKAIGYALDKLNYPYSEELIIKIDGSIPEYEKYYDKYDKKNMLEFINQHLGISLPNTFMDVWLEEQAIITDIDKDTIDTLEYLYNKYELVALTNWFTDSQTKRLKQAGLLKYISKVYGGDMFLIKPNKEGFIKAMEGLTANECVMIGDNIDCDIKPALSLGIPVIHYNCRNKTEDNNYPMIKDIKQLKDIL